MAAEPEWVSPTFRVDVPAGTEGGSFADFLSVWHTPHDFVLDFAATQMPEHGDEEGSLVVPCHVTARVRIPPTLVFDVLRAVSDNLARYEASYGSIKKPGEGADDPLEGDQP